MVFFILFIVIIAFTIKEKACLDRNIIHKRRKKTMDDGSIQRINNANNNNFSKQKTNSAHNNTSICQEQTSTQKKKSSKKNRRLFKGAILAESLMVFICGLRSVDVGVDTSNYYDIFTSGASRFMELGITVLSIIGHLLGNSFQVFLFLFALVSLLPIFYFINKRSQIVSFSLLIYLSFSNFFYPETFNTIRATAAIGLFTIAVLLVEKNRYKYAIIWFILSCSFHISAIAAGVLVLLGHLIKNFSKYATFTIIASSILFGLVFSTGFSAYAEVISIWLSTLTGDFADYYLHHFKDLEETEFNLVGVLSNMLPFSLFAIILYDNYNAKNIYYKLLVIGVVISNTFISIALVYRITMFLTLYLIIVLPNTHIRTHGFRRLALNGLILFMLLWYVYKLFGSTSDSMAGTIPYTFFFE